MTAGAHDVRKLPASSAKVPRCVRRIPAHPRVVISRAIVNRVEPMTRGWAVAGFRVCEFTHPASATAHHLKYI
jgi:hypothetical protein